MFQVCIHGRGGQGVVTAAELLAQAAFREGHDAQVIPSFGSERTGAPVVSFCRLSDGPIHTREPVHTPDAVIVQDPTLLTVLDPFAGVSPGGWGIVNTRRTPGAVRRVCPSAPEHLVTVPADSIVREHLGQPKPSAALLGAFAALTGQVSLEAVLTVIGERFAGSVAAGNARSASAAYRWVLDVVDGDGSPTSYAAATLTTKEADAHA